MTEEQLTKHRKWCIFKYGNDGEEIYREAYTIALERYKTIEKVNQNLFSKICREAARELLTHRKHEIPFSCLIAQNEDQTDEVVFDPEDPTWRKDFDAIEIREEIQKIHGQWLLNALMKATDPNPVRKEEEKEEQLQFEFA